MLEILKIDRILDMAIGTVLLALLVAGGLLVWSYVEPDDSWAVSKHHKGYSHPRVNGRTITVTDDGGCLSCHRSLP